MAALLVIGSIGAIAGSTTLEANASTTLLPTNGATSTTLDTATTVAPTTAEAPLTIAPTSSTPPTTAPPTTRPTTTPPSTAAPTTTTTTTTTATTTTTTTTVPPTTVPPTTIPPTTAAAPTPVIPIVRVIDGDTVEIDGDTIRLRGIDTPERGECGYAEATRQLEALLAGQPITLIGDERDRYDRRLAYVDTPDGDAGLDLISTGHAIARYDSRDGYGSHPREDEYVFTDGATAPAGCQQAAPPAPAPATPAATPQEPSTGERQPDIPPTGPDLDCGDIGRKVWVGSNDYHRLDRDGDGWGCDSYG